MEEKDYEKIKAEYEAATDAALVAWARTAKGKDEYVISTISDRAAEDIKELTRSDVKGFHHIIRGDEVAHIRKRHGKNGKADSSMSDENDLGRIGYVLRNYDEIEVISNSSGFLNNNHKLADMIRFIKRIDGHVYTAEAVTDSRKKKALHIVSMYKAKTLIKESRTVTDQQIFAPPHHVQDASNSSIHSIPQNNEKVNTPREKNLKNFKTFCEKHKSVSGNQSEVQRHPTEKGKGK